MVAAMQQVDDTPVEGLPTALDVNSDRSRLLSTRDLFRGTRRIDIEHQGECYRLQITRRGKLILTK